MRPRLLLDTHVLIRYIAEVHRLPREQARELRLAERRSEILAVSAMSLLEIAMLQSAGRVRLRDTLHNFFGRLRDLPAIQIVPITDEIALEVALLGPLNDPADKAIVATARVHGLQLVTSDQRIIESQLV